MKILKGWIAADKSDEDLLISLGVKLGNFDSVKGYSDCEVDEETMNKLDEYWGQFYWGLFLVEKNDVA